MGGCSSAVVLGASRSSRLATGEGRLEPLRPLLQTQPHRLPSLIAAPPRPPALPYCCRSVFYLPKPRALNWLVASAFGKPTLVLQAGARFAGDVAGGSCCCGGGFLGLVLGLAPPLLLLFTPALQHCAAPLPIAVDTRSDAFICEHK